MKITVDGSGLKKLIKEIGRLQAKLPQGIARGLNEGGDKVRTQVQRALHRQTGLVRYRSVTERVRTARGFAEQGDLNSMVQGSSIGQGIQYRIIVTGKPTRADEFRTRVVKGPGRRRDHGDVEHPA